MTVLTPARLLLHLPGVLASTDFYSMLRQRISINYSLVWMRIIHKEAINCQNVQNILS